MYSSMNTNGVKVDNDCLNGQCENKTFCDENGVESVSKETVYSETDERKPIISSNGHCKPETHVSWKQTCDVKEQLQTSNGNANGRGTNGVNQHVHL